MTRDNEQYAYLTFTGDFDPNTITEQLKLSPTKCWRKGDLNERNSRERKFSRWCLYSRLNTSASLEDHVRDVLNQTAKRADDIAQLASTYNGQMQLVGYFHQFYPGFGLDSKTVSQLAELKLGIDCDFYYLYSDDREDS